MVKFGNTWRYSVVMVHFINIASTLNSTSSRTSVTTNTPEDTTASSLNSTDITSTTTDEFLVPETVVLTNGFIPMIIGIAVGVGIVAVAILVTAIIFAVLKHKKVHPSDEETIFSDSASESDYDSRPTTASHIFVDQSDDAPSRPVTMTPFELRKLFVETFPYEKWKPGFDGNLRPRMPLKFVHPSKYRRTKLEEREFRKKIHQFEKTENLTISRPPSSTLMRSPRSRPYTVTPSTLDTVPERVYHNGMLRTESGEHLRLEANGTGDSDKNPNGREILGLKSSHNVEAVVHSQGVDNNAEATHNTLDLKASTSKDSSDKEGDLKNNIKETEQRMVGAEVTGSQSGRSSGHSVSRKDNKNNWDDAQGNVKPGVVNDDLKVEHFDDVMTTEL